jgi:diguanylate cyclase (GGDEF)-like protein
MTGQATSPARGFPWSVLRSVRRALPRGGTLPAEEWDERHRGLLIFLWLNVVAIPAYGVVTGKYGVLHDAGHAAGLLVFAVLAMLPRLGRAERAAAVSLGLLTAAALLVHLTGGLIEAHFYFFVMIVVLTLYEDWRPFLIAVGYVLFHHGVVGMLEPKTVFNRPDAWAHPWKWASIHALFVAAAGAAALVAWRLNENVRERMLAAQAQLAQAALVDSLTELPNRRQLMLDLEQAVSDRSPTLLALFDLDGFKGYNDSFGHTAGDTLLSRLGGRLAAAAHAPARAYRLGGDEFCLLAPAADLDVDELLSRAHRALSEHGEGFAVSCSYGSALVPSESRDAEGALQLADQRMYAHKNGGRPTAGRQVSDALLRALEERVPDLGEHLDGVAELSEAVARRLGLDADQVARTRLAAELHDIGKVAIPDAILLKPEPLAPEEREFIERHTLIGERIVSAAPALSHVAGLVRSSHERVDGSGYPDRLAGEQIPLGSRIVGVCDAFDAMVSPRPYRPDALTEREAVDELRRCAGTQFDAAVVEAFTAVLAERRRVAELAA